MSVLTQPKRQIAAKVESVEGTAESLTAAEAKHLVLDDGLSYKADIAMHDRPIVQASYSRHKRLAGVESGMISLAVELRGSGTATTKPSWDELVRACAFDSNDVEVITIGAITGGPFEHGEVVTGGTSSATGRVIGTTENGVTSLYMVVTSGTFQSGEVLTGGTSSATATTSSTSTAAGFVYEPISDSIPSLTIAMYHEGLKKALVGARGSLKIEGEVGGPAVMMMEFTGVYVDVADVALLSGITYESTIPPVLKGTTLEFDSFTPVVTSFGLDLQNVVALRESMAATRGAISARITGRDPMLSINPELDLVANFDYYGRMQGETLHRTEFDVGATAGNRFKVIVPETQVTQVTESDRTGVSAVDLNCAVLGNTDYQDEEVALLVY